MKWLARALFVLGILLVVVGPMAFGWWVVGPGVLLFSIPLVAYFASRGLVHGVPGFAKMASDHAVEEWQGAYYAFDDFQVRIYEHDERLWFVTQDLVRALGWKALPQGFLATHRRSLHRVEGTRLDAVDLAGLDALLGARREPDCGRLLRWAHREVAAPWERKQADGKRQSITVL